jgi:peptidoglycan/xylan/chitin deacetylase (PgdA/CDA1 family)
MSNGIFVVSLDFELHWGGFEKWQLSDYAEYFTNTRNVIPNMLKYFENNHVHATWAAVGMLFHQNRESLLQSAATLEPSYDVEELSAYNFIRKSEIGETEDDDPFHYASSLINKIINTPFQELGSHTFAHYYCNEPGQTIEQFTADLQAAQRSAKLFHRSLKSLVFPRNQFNEQYLRACFDHGFIAVRDNPRDWFWNIQSTQRESIWKRFNRGMDAYLTIGKLNTYSIESLERRTGLPVSIPASRLLRPYRPKEWFLNEVKISRIKAEMTRAAKNGQVYHLWWHPHNFGHYPKESMEGLKKILDNFSMCRERYGMKSLSMAEVAELVINRA